MLHSGQAVPAVKRWRGPLRRISVTRLGVAAIIVTTAALAFALPGGFFRVMFRGAIFIGAIILIGSYVLEWWLKRRGRI